MEEQILIDELFNFIHFKVIQLYFRGFSERKEDVLWIMIFQFKNVTMQTSPWENGRSFILAIIFYCILALN